MYSLIKERTYAQLASRQLPEVVGAMLIAELFYKFHSFTLESVAFLGTWYAIDFAIEQIAGLMHREARMPAAGSPL